MIEWMWMIGFEWVNDIKYLKDDIFPTPFQRQKDQDKDKQATGWKNVFLATESFLHQKSNHRLQISRQYSSLQTDKYYDVETFYLSIDQFYNSQV